ncbi:hypothetical protein SK128_009759 [Halocaridina rubra]|uniref:Transmembrane protein n=1 Tax=Halocaridina rubra TaxID=373956 RepID=A0AAN8X302_HALRR
MDTDNRLRIASFTLKFALAVLVGFALVFYDRPEDVLFLKNVTIRHLLIGTAFLVLSTLVTLLIEVCCDTDGKKKKCRLFVMIMTLMLQAFKLVIIVLITITIFQNTGNQYHSWVTMQEHMADFYFWFSLFAMLISIADLGLLLSLSCRVGKEIRQRKYRELKEDINIELA